MTFLPGRLVPGIDDWDLPRLKVNIAYLDRKSAPSKVRALIDSPVEHFDAMERERQRPQSWS